MQYTEAVARKCSVKKMFLEISQNSQENTSAKVSFLTKLQALGLRRATLLKKRLWHRCFPVNFAKFLRTPFLKPAVAASAEAYSEPCQTFKMELFAKIVND